MMVWYNNLLNSNETLLSCLVKWEKYIAADLAHTRMNTYLPAGQGKVPSSIRGGQVGGVHPGTTVLQVLENHHRLRPKQAMLPHQLTYLVKAAVGLL